MVAANLKRTTTVLIGHGQCAGGHNLKGGREGHPSGGQFYVQITSRWPWRGVP
jgi:hypothetical protein